MPSIVLNRTRVKKPFARRIRCIRYLQLLFHYYNLFLDPVKRTDSIQKRKVSSLSDRSDTSEPGAPGDTQSGEESPGILSDEQPPESPSDSNDTDDTSKHLPWMKVKNIKICFE